jgi:hypothetical protein
MSAWSRFSGLAAAIVVASAVAGCDVKLKTIDLIPVQTFQGFGGGGGASGYCFNADSPNMNTFSPGTGQIIVGFDDWFSPGSDPFPCNVYRSFVFRAGVKFDLSQFNSIVAANLLFDTGNSISRQNGEVVGQSPPASFATTLGLAHNTLGTDNDLVDDDEASLAPTSGSLNVGVSSQVRDWLNGSHANNGFVIGGPLAVPTNNFPEDNNAQVSFYQNFRLQVLYNPAQNPNAPQ